MIQNKKTDVCYDFDANTHSKCKAMNFMSLIVKRENKSELRFKKIVENLILNSYSCAECDECTF